MVLEKMMLFKGANVISLFRYYRYLRQFEHIWILLIRERSCQLARWVKIGWGVLEKKIILDCPCWVVFAVISIYKWLPSTLSIFNAEVVLVYVDLQLCKWQGGHHFRVYANWNIHATLFIKLLPSHCRLQKLLPIFLAELS